MRGARLLELMRAPWALERRTFDLMSEVVQRWVREEGPAPAVREQVNRDRMARDDRRAAARASSGGGVAVISLLGIIAQRGNLIDDVSGPGSMSTMEFSRVLADSMDDDTVSSVLIDIDSPGGSVYGVAELSDEIYRARAKKPIIGFANSLAASGAYWLGCQCSEFYCTPGGEVGSIGVIAAHTDRSKQNEMIGLRVRYITAGKYKSEGNPDEPLSEEGLEYEQTRVNAYYGMFTRHLARGRGVTVAQARSDDWGAGRLLGAAQAADVGMIDGVRTFADVLRRAGQLAKDAKSARATQLARTRRALNAQILESAGVRTQAELDAWLTTTKRLPPP